MESQLITLVSIIVSKELSEVPFEVRRMTMGGCNEVYSAVLPSRSVIVRMNEHDRYLRGSERNIPLLRSLGIDVPEILASDYSRQFAPLCYQIQTCLKGTDLGHVIGSLSDQQLTEIGKRVVEIFNKVRSVATNGKFGYIYGDDQCCRDSWSEVIADMVAEVERRNAITSVVGPDLLKVAHQVFNDCEAYFDSVPSVCFFDDISSKNVLVHDGTFTGIVDLDGLAYGDPLEAVGRIKACWFGTRHGQTYLSALERGLNLTDYQKRVVTAYAVLHRISWLSEKGIQFNLNTSTSIDAEQVERDKTMITALCSEIQKGQ